MAVIITIPHKVKANNNLATNGIIGIFRKSVLNENSKIENYSNINFLITRKTSIVEQR